MSGATGLGLILGGFALIAFLYGQGVVAGLRPDEFAALISIVAVALLISGAVIREFHGHWTRGVQALLFWVALIASLVGLHGYGPEIQDGIGRLVGAVSPSEPVVGSGGEVSVARRLDGSFVVTGRVNDRDLRFVFDTGASTVVLTAESAQALGLSPATLNYIVPVATANGRTLAAPVTLASLTIGSITERRVGALVTRPGLLRENLLGMSFLERLTSYEVRGNRLILRGRGARLDKAGAVAGPTG